MPKKPLNPCAVYNCPNLTEGTYCEVYQKEWNKEYRTFNRGKELQSFYQSKEWRELNILVKVTKLILVLTLP